MFEGKGPFYFVVKHKAKPTEVIAGRVFTDGVHVIENEEDAKKASTILCRYHNVEVTDVDPRKKAAEKPAAEKPAAEKPAAEKPAAK